MIEEETPRISSEFHENTLLDMIEGDLEAIDEVYSDTDDALDKKIEYLRDQAIEILEEMYAVPEGELGDPDLSHALKEVVERLEASQAIKARRS